MKTLVLAASLLVLPGCVLAAGPAVGAGIVHATGEDAAEVRLDVNGAAAFAASREEAVHRGTIVSAHPDLGILEARIGTSSVEVTVVEEGDDGRSRVTVKARAAGGLAPDPETARILAVAIVRRTL